MTFEESLIFLDGFINYETRSSFRPREAFNPERFKSFLSFLGDPQKNLKVIHIAGTKGKGSVACFLAHILKENGFTTGLYTSPHLEDIRERIRILDPDDAAQENNPFSGMILKNDFSGLMEELKVHIEGFSANFKKLGSLTFFEIITALAILYFVRRKTDFVILETGMGGRFDATNAVNSMVSIITSINYDHQHALGTTLVEIAYEKAGIIKEGNIKTKDGLSICVCASQEKEVNKVIRRRAKTNKAILFERGKHFYFKRLSGDLFSQDFFYKGLNNVSMFLKVRMLGIHQIENASLAVACCEALSLHGIKVRSDSIEKGLLKAFWPGRLEVVRTKPFIILDGAHNRDSAERLADFVEKEFKKFKKWLVFGVSEDKDIKGIVERLEAFADRVIITSSNNPRSADPNRKIKGFFKRTKPETTRSVEEAVDILNKEIKEDEVAIITGSLFVVGQARSLWQR